MQRQSSRRCSAQRSAKTTGPDFQKVSRSLSLRARDFRLFVASRWVKEPASKPPEARPAEVFPQTEPAASVKPQESRLVVLTRLSWAPAQHSRQVPVSVFELVFLPAFQSPLVTLGPRGCQQFAAVVAWRFDFRPCPYRGPQT